MESNKISKKVARQIQALHKQLQKLNRFDEFTLLDLSSASINNFDLFKNIISDKLRLYESLNFLMNSPTKSERSVGFDPDMDPVFQTANFLNKQGLSSVHNRSLLHFTTFEKIQFKMEGIFCLVEEYLDQLDTDLHQEHFQEMLEANLDQLRAVLIDQQDSVPERVRRIEEEFQKIDQILRKKLNFERENVARILEGSEESLRKEMVRTRDKAVMVIEPGNTKKEENGAKYIDIEKIKVEVEVQKTDYKPNDADSEAMKCICLTGENSFLTALDHSGISVTKNGQVIYSKKFKDDMKNIGDAVYCNGSYYIYNYQTPGRILRKAEDSSDPEVWWDRQPIEVVFNKNKNIRVNQKNTALIINVNDTDLAMIEVRKDGKAGREVIIKNQTGSRINFHEALRNSRILAVTKQGVLAIYKVDYVYFSKAWQLMSWQIEFKPKRKEMRTNSS